jgi:epoxyqueuosine reductase QueG
MTFSQTLTDYALNLFNVAGTTQSDNNVGLIIIGLETTAERDLDEFHLIDGSFNITGFEKHAKAGLDSLLSFIRQQGFSAELIGRCGYPLKGEIKLKENAVRAGLGRWGKNTVVLHPKYGNRLRFMAIKTNAPLESCVADADIRKENPSCNRCSLCIEACPVNIIEPYRLTDTGKCLANNSANTNSRQGRLKLCDICLRVCPKKAKKSRNFKY